jgi:predicted transposase/invertase (TIGR01784 family)
MFIDKPIEEMTTTERWAAYFQYLTNETKREKIKEIIDGEEGIAMATNALYQVSAEYEAYALQTSLMKGELDWRSSMKDAERRGLAEGRMEGRNEASLDIAQKMKNAGRPLSEITEFTGLPMETITQL